MLATRIISSSGELDPYWSSRVLLLHYDGADASTTFTDERGHAFTAVGNAQIDTAQSLYGGASCYLDGSGDYIWAADSADWDFGTGDFEIEIARRFEVVPSGGGVATLISNYNAGTSGWGIQYRTDTGGNRLRFFATGNTNNFDFAWTPAANTWYRISVARVGTGLIARIDGTQIGTTQTCTVNISGSPAPLWIGGLNLSGGTQFFRGWMDEDRLTRGPGVHAADYTPDGAAFPNG